MSVLPTELHGAVLGNLDNHLQVGLERWEVKVHLTHSQEAPGRVVVRHLDIRPTLTNPRAILFVPQAMYSVPYVSGWPSTGCAAWALIA